MNKEKLKDECLKRMSLIKLSKQCISAFKKGDVWLSERYGALYELDEEQKRIVELFEKEYGGMVYHIIHNMFEFGECFTLFYVSKNQDEWEEDIEDLKNEYAFTYVYNKDDNNCSEFGTVGFKSSIGGLVRTA